MNESGLNPPVTDSLNQQEPRHDLASDPRGLVNADIQYSIRLLTDTFVKTTICVFGTGANIVNVIVFYQTGVKDSVAVAFFALAFADVGVVFFTLVYQLLETLDLVVQLATDVNLRHLAYYLNYFVFMCIDISSVITVFASLQKCACVAIPFLFKKIFTYEVSKVVIVTIYFVLMVYYIPILTTSMLTLQLDPRINRTRYSFPSTPLRAQIVEVFEIFNRIILPISSVLIVTASLIILNTKLVEASKTRHTMTSRKGNSGNKGGAVEGKNYLSQNEVKVIESVLLISIIFVACNIPDMLSFLVSCVVPEFGYLGKYAQSYRLVRAVQNVLAVTNSSVTIVVYVRYNRKYRRGFLHLFRRVWSVADGQLKAQTTA